MPLVSFYTAWKHKKMKGFLMFSGGKKETFDIKRVEQLVIFFF